MTMCLTMACAAEMLKKIERVTRYFILKIILPKKASMIFSNKNEITHRILNLRLEER